VPGALATDRLSVPSDLKVVSYFPADAGWTEMWTDWHPDEIAKDLDRVVALHANTVRAVIELDTFGWPDVQPVYAARLQQFVSMAGDRGLHVQLTLFDWWYRRPWVRASKQWARELLTPYIDDPRIAFLEVRNEILPKPETDKWAKKMIPFLRTLLPGTPVTLSVAGLDPVARLALLKRGLGAAQPDFWDIHYFGGGGGANAYAVFAAAKAIAGSTPLWVGETGYPTVTDSGGYGGIPWTRASQEAAQSHFLASVAWAAQRRRIGAGRCLGAGRPRAVRRARSEGGRRGSGSPLRAVPCGRIAEACGGDRARFLRRRDAARLQQQLRGCRAGRFGDRSSRSVADARDTGCVHGRPFGRGRRLVVRADGAVRSGQRLVLDRAAGRRCARGSRCSRRGVGAALGPEWTGLPRR
jgi:hypothetical protein